MADIAAGSVGDLSRRFALGGETTLPRDRFPGLSQLLANVTLAVDSGPLTVHLGTVRAIGHNVIEVSGLSRYARLNDYVIIQSKPKRMIAQTVAVSGDRVAVNPLSEPVDARVGDAVFLHGPLKFWPDDSWRGRIVDAFCRPIDGKGELTTGEPCPDINRRPPAAMKRKRLGKRVTTGISAIDLFTPISYGQRLGIMGGTGTGKSSLLTRLVNSGGFDVAVVALIGERGREVREFVEDGLGDGISNATIVATTGDETPSVRALAAESAMLIAEHFRDSGQRVLFLFDSVTRYAHAIREISLAAGEMPVARGHTTMLYSALAKLLERAGPGEGEGTITGIYSVLVDGDDHNEPVSDAVRGILDGHIVLDRTIAATGRFPAIDVSSSVSRLSERSIEPRYRALVDRVRQLISIHGQVEELRQIGGYVAGADPLADLALRVVPLVYELISQPMHEPAAAAIDPFARLEALLRENGAVEEATAVTAAQAAEAQSDAKSPTEIVPSPPA